MRKRLPEGVPKIRRCFALSSASCNRLSRSVSTSRGAAPSSRAKNKRRAPDVSRQSVLFPEGFSQMHLRRNRQNRIRIVRVLSKAVKDRVHRLKHDRRRPRKAPPGPFRRRTTNSGVLHTRFCPRFCAEKTSNVGVVQLSHHVDLVPQLREPRRAATTETRVGEREREIRFRRVKVLAVFWLLFFRA